MESGTGRLFVGNMGMSDGRSEEGVRQGANLLKNTMRAADMV